MDRHDDGAQTFGAILVPLNTGFKGAEAGDILRRSGVRMLFTLNGFLGTHFAGAIAGEDLPELEAIIEFRGRGSGRPEFEAFLARGDGVPPEDVVRMAAEVSPDDIVDLMFTSGTTGRPKGALFTHGQNIECYRKYAAVWGLRRDDVYMIVPPFFHTFGYKAGWLSCAITGARMLPVSTFDVDEVLRTIELEKVSVLTGPPTVFHSILSHPRRRDFDLSSLRLSMTGAASVPVDLVRRMESDLQFETVTVAYGMTECNSYCCCTRPGDDPALVSTSVGIALPEVEMRCVDPAGNALPAGENGEILIRGPMLTTGYFGDPQATAEAIDADGWLHSGDVGHLGPDGYLRVTDRLKDMYISGGFNCYPAEIEKALSGLSGVLQVAVIGVPDERMGDVGKAFVIRAPDAVLTETDVIAWARDRIANYKVPRFVEFVDAFPLNASGKVRKTELRRLELERPDIATS